jgi:hypothetical protein
VATLGDSSPPNERGIVSDNALLARLILWLVMATLALVLFATQPQNFGGDFIEYYGVTESLMTDGVLYLTQQAESQLQQRLPPSYLYDSGYYMQGKDGNRYPVHFVFYSLLCLPARLMLRDLGINELYTFRVVNLALFFPCLYIVLTRYLRSTSIQPVFVIATCLSSYMSFIAWPGPDIYYLSILLLGIYSFYGKRYFTAAILTAFASWHSQPLALLAGGAAIYVLWGTLRYHGVRGNQRPRYRYLQGATIISIISVLILLPYLYNITIFGFISPWLVLQDGWTQLNGFGIHNISLRKFYEQILDLNIGIFWYNPVICVGGLYTFMRRASRDRQTLLVLMAVLATSFMYQMNPGWHYGTSGYGPTRHILFILPFLIYFLVDGFVLLPNNKILLTLLIVTQFGILQFNGFVVPDARNTLRHSPYARLVLNVYPALYNPTPEIFVDRTTYTDLPYPHSAIYTYNGRCRKAYVLPTEIHMLVKTCGPLSEADQAKLAVLANTKSPAPQGIYVNYDP